MQPHDRQAQMEDDRGHWCEEHDRWECVCPRVRNRGRCHGPAVKGAPRCRLHLGVAMAEHRERMAAEAERAEAVSAAEAAATTFGVEVDTSAEDALFAALRRSLGLVLYYRGRVAALPADQLAYGTERVTRRRHLGENNEVVIEDTTVAKTVVNIWVRLLNDAEDRHVKVAAEIARLQLDARRVKLVEDQVELFYKAMLRGLAEFGIREDDERIPFVIERVMGEVAG